MSSSAAVPVPPEAQAAAAWFRFMLPAFAGLLLIGAVAIAMGGRTGF